MPNMPYINVTDQSTLNWLSNFFIAWPILVMALVLTMGRKNARWVALLGTIVQLGVTLFALSHFSPADGEQFKVNELWMAQFNIRYYVSMDGISMLLVLLTNLLLPLIVLSSFRHHYQRSVLFYSMVLLMQSALVGVFIARDIFLYYIFWELALIPIYVIILMYGGSNRVKVTFKFFIYTLAGSLLMLVAIIWLKMSGYTGEVPIVFSPTIQHLLFWAFFIAFAIKMPVFPFHTWQPDTYTQAPPQGSMLLAGIMLKMGVYSVIRWLLPLTHDVLAIDGKIAMALSVTGIVYGSWIAVTQKDIKRLFAYSSFAHVGLISAGIFSLTYSGLQGSMIQMFSHGINVVGLFFVAQIIYERVRSNNIPELGGIINQAPVFSTFFMIILLGSVALPLTNGFVGEFMLLQGVFQYSTWLGAAAGLTIIFGAVYMLRAYQHSMLGEVNPNITHFEDLKPSETIVMATIAALILFIGVYPKPLLGLTEPAINDLLKSLPQTITTK